LARVATAQAKVFEYVVEVDHGGRMTVPGGAQIERPEGWSADHLLLAALVRCSVDSLTYHAHRAGHEASASGSAQGTITKRESDGRYAFVAIRVALDVQLTPRSEDPSDLIAKAERDCFVGASLTVKPDYTWRIA
jgi:organic hydroperoxide reductase OsmC/OhrA